MESIPGLHKRLKIRAQDTKGAGIDSSESVPGLLKRLQIRALDILVFSSYVLRMIYVNYCSK